MILAEVNAQCLVPSIDSLEVEKNDGVLFCFVFYKFIYLIYLFLAVLGLRCCAWVFPRCGERGLLFVVVCGLLIAVDSLVAEHRL